MEFGPGREKLSETETDEERVSTPCRTAFGIKGRSSVALRRGWDEKGREMGSEANESK